MSPSTLQDWLTYLEKLHPKSIELGLERVNAVRQRMGLVPGFPLITVGGTNGKGSTCAMLESILAEAGYRVGCYTSPHLLHYNERIRVQRTEIDDGSLCRAFSGVEAARGDIPLTYFEFGTLAAVRHFVEAEVDVAVLEIGLGGRLDAVNVFEPSCSIVTSIDLDHLDYLGNSRESIGYEKAGIYRAGVPAICGEPTPPGTVPQSAFHAGADYRQIGVDFGCEQYGQCWNFWSKDARIEGLPFPALYGSFQLGNAACVLEALRAVCLLLPVSVEQIHAGLTHVVLSGRFQVLPGKPQVILDVAHNPHAAHGLGENLRLSRKQGRTLAVFAMLADKDIAGVVQAVEPEIYSWFLAGIDYARGASAEQLVDIVSANAPGSNIMVFDSITNALAQACRSAGENDRIVVFGSFYTVADALRALPTTQSGLKLSDNGFRTDR
jgi:dihydrofolate synthase/folylpolyglutamate synthase